MKVTLDTKDLAKYPFLKESQHLINSFADDLGSFLASNTGRLVIRNAGNCIKEALSFHESKVSVAETEVPPQIAIATYAVSRILVSCSKERSLIERFVNWQSWQFYRSILDESWDKKKIIAERIGMDVSSSQIPVRDYVENVYHLREGRWRLVNRSVNRGLVTITPEETDELIRERLRSILRNQLPLSVPQPICSILSPVIDAIHQQYQQKILEEFGSIEESAYPPCINALLKALASGENITHIGRFAATAFLHNIGMNNTTIVELYGRAPDFDIERTMYQVDHISGMHGIGTEYVAPGCSTMRTHSICVHPDSLCKEVNHPLSYYKRKKKEKFSKKSAKTQSVVNDNKKE